MTKRIGIMTPGGDAPGMNACIWSITLTALSLGYEVWGIPQGLKGLLASEFIPLGRQSINGITRQAGTILGSARMKKPTPDQLTKALENLTKMVDVLIIIGGNGSQSLASALYQASKSLFPTVGIAATIDNDLIGSNPTIGADTASNVALNTIDKIRATAASFERAFLVEVMGRDTGDLAQTVGLAAGAHAVITPECPIDPLELAEIIRKTYRRGDSHCIIVVAEGAAFNAQELEAYFKEQEKHLGFELRLVILGHAQRGGKPTAFDRALGIQLGAHAVEAIDRGEHGKLVGKIGDKVVMTPLTDVANKKKSADTLLIQLANRLNR